MLRNSNKNAGPVLSCYRLSSKRTIGGLCALWGPVTAAVIMVPLNDLLRAKLGSSMSGLSTVIYGVALCLIVYFMPEGLWKPISSLGNKLLGDKKTAAAANKKEEGK